MRPYLFAGLVLAAACGGPNTPGRAPLADKWVTRAQASYKAGDFDDAKTASESALQAAPSDPDVRTLAARMALVHLDFKRVLELTEGLQTADVHGLRGRAHWYLGDVERAADELEAALTDPNLKDPWAHDIARLARKGHGKRPFTLEGSVVAAVEMPPAGAAMVVPCELEGEHILAMVATGSAEVVLDSNSRREPAWVDLRFGDEVRGAVEVRDVPALTRDLSALSRQLQAPIKALLGVNLLRRAHATFDRHGAQFVVRRDPPPPPPDASRVPLWYVRGGGMIMRAQVAHRDEGATTLFVDSVQAYPLALDEPAWKKAGIDTKSLQVDPASPKLKGGRIPIFTIGGVDLPEVPAYAFGPTITDAIPPLDVDLQGVLGAGLLAFFRVTFGDEGRFVWMEPDPTLLAPPPPSRAMPPAIDAPPDEPKDAPKDKPKPKSGEGKK